MVGIPLYSVEMLSRGLKCFLEGWNAFERVGIPLYRVAMVSTELEYLCTGLKWILVGWNAFYRVGMLSTELERFRQRWSTFVQGCSAF
jgi:hypothetical protein